eukprot:TRINITY_DN15029_c0_g1_i1.p1 TRINITY_DN15029_c0_g1~~TRINITY_DN15029_c0_g1_i1.p1  ORF type:complete len:325 (+),score=88.90 TRINITY_DN15029_c0_g1_i1:105-1079(+)
MGGQSVLAAAPHGSRKRLQVQGDPFENSGRSSNMSFGGGTALTSEMEDDVDAQSAPRCSPELARAPVSPPPPAPSRDAVVEGAALLFSLVTTGVAPPTSCDAVTVFDADPLQPPVILIQSYLRHWMTHSECSIECAAIAIALVLRTRLPVHSLNQHRLLLGALVTAAKWRDDLYYSNEFYAGVGGVSLAELNRLEADMLRKCDWRTHVGWQEWALVQNALLGGMRETEELAWRLRDGAGPPALAPFQVQGARRASSGRLRPPAAERRLGKSVPVDKAAAAEEQAEEEAVLRSSNVCRRMFTLVGSKAAGLWTWVCGKSTAAAAA